MPLSDYEIKHLLEKAEAYRDKKDLQSLEQALKCYDQIIENAPPHPHYFTKRADIKYLIRHKRSFVFFDIQDVIEDVSNAIELDPDNGSYYLQRGIYLSEKLNETNISDNDRKQLLERIIVDYKASVQRDPTNPQTLESLMEINILSHNFEDAISIYGSCRPFIKTKEDQLIRAWLGCLALTFAGDPIEEEDRRPLYDQSIHLGLEGILLRITSFLSEIREQEGYKEKGEAAIEIHKRFIIDHLKASDRGTLLSGLNCYVEAGEAFDKAINLSPENVLALHSKGLILQKLKHYEAALEAFEKVIDLQPDDAKVWFNKADVLKNLGCYDEAFKACDRAIELSPDDLKCNVAENFAHKLAELGRYDEAFKACDRAIELSPDDLEKEKTALYFAEKLAELGRYEEAFKACDRAIELSPDDLEKYCVAQSFAKILAELCRYDEAFKAWDRAIELSPDDDARAWAWYSRACIYSLKNDKESTLTNLSRAIELSAEYKAEAREDEDFKNLWDDEDFKRIVG